MTQSIEAKNKALVLEAFDAAFNQRDPGATRKLIETLKFGQVEIGRSADGSAVIPMHQPYSGWAKALLERQHYPEDRLYPGGPPKRPYDVTAQTLPMLMGVDVVTVKDSFRAALKPASQFAFELNHAGPAGAMAASDVYSWKSVALLWKSGKPVYRDPATGDFYTAAANGRKEVKAPRVGMYQSYVPSMDEGWTRWLFDDFGFGYTSLHDADIKSGNLRARFDTIVIPDQPPQQIAQGHRDGTMPPEYCGGLGEKGAAALKEFAEHAS